MTPLLNGAADPKMRVLDGSLVGAAEKLVTSSQQVMQLIHLGTQHQQTRTTDMNQNSSRSHAIVTLYLERRTKAAIASATYVRVISKFNLVDLAGSEGLVKSGTSSHCDTGTDDGNPLCLHSPLISYRRRSPSIPACFLAACH